MKSSRFYSTFMILIILLAVGIGLSAGAVLKKEKDRSCEVKKPQPEKKIETGTKPETNDRYYYKGIKDTPPNINSGNFKVRSISTDRLPKEKLRRLMLEGSGDEIISLYKKYDVDINTSLHHSLQFPLFHYLVFMNFKAANELYTAGYVDISKSPAVLTIAAAHGDTEIIRFLMDIGCNPNGDQKKFCPPFIRAIMYNKLEAAKILEQNGANPMSVFKKRNALDWASISKFVGVETLDYLTSKGISYKPSNAISAVKKGRTKIIRHIFESKPELVKTKSGSENLLDMAVKGSGGSDIIKFLLDKGMVLEKKHLDMAEKRFKSAYSYTKDGGGIIIPEDKKAEEVYSFIQKRIQTTYGTIN